MQIAFCIFKYFPYGGIQRDLMKIARVALARGHEVRIYAIFWDAETPDSIDVVKVPVSALTHHQLYELYAEWVHDHLRENPVDIVVGMNKMPGLDVYYAGDSCYEEKARTQRGNWYRMLPRYRHFARFERAVFDPLVSTQILTISDRQTPYFRKHYGTSAQRFHPLPPGIDRDRIAPADRHERGARVRAELGIAEPELLLLFVGSGFVKKGLDRALLALHALPGELKSRTRLVVIGRDHAEPFRRMAKRLGVQERVTFFDEGRPDVPDFLFAADGLVLPAYDENAGMVILESMVAGLPALVTANCGYAPYLADADAGIVAPDPFVQEAFNQLLVTLLTSERRDAWRVNGMALADRDDIFALGERAVDYIERFQAERRPLLAFAVFKYFPFGGLQRDLLKVAHACQQRGYRIRIYTLSWEGDLPAGFDLVVVPSQGLTNHRRYSEFAQWVADDLRWRPADALIGFNKMPGLDLYYAADSCYEKKAQELRSPAYRRTGRYALFSRFERSVFGDDSDTRILLISEKQREDFLHYYQTDIDRFSVLPPGVGRDRKRPADAEKIRRAFREEYALSETDRLLLLVGSGFITKGLDRALLGLASLPEDALARTRLFVVGQDNPRQFLTMAEELGVQEQVTIFSGRDDVPRFMLGADILVHPAYVESGGIVLLEALIAGLPVLATDVCGFAFYVHEARGGVLVPSPYEQAVFNAQLASLVTEDSTRAELARNGIAFGQRNDIFAMPERAAALIEEHLGARALPA